ncbi:MAG: hypothetical protein V1707_01885 [bacterium]
MKFFFIFIVLFTLTVSITVPLSVTAQTQVPATNSPSIDDFLKGLDSAADSSALTVPDKKDHILIEYIIRLVKIALSVLGLIFLIQTMYSGFIWMFDRGNAKAMEAAQGRLKTAVLGLAIVVFSYALTVWLSQTIQTAVTGINPASQPRQQDNPPSQPQGNVCQQAPCTALRFNQAQFNDLCFPGIGQCDGCSVCYVDPTP